MGFDDSILLSECDHEILFKNEAGKTCLVGGKKGVSYFGNF